MAERPSGLNLFPDKKKTVIAREGHAIDEIAIKEALGFIKELSESTRLGCSALEGCGVIPYHEQQVAQLAGFGAPGYGDCTDIYTVACRNSECPVLAQFMRPPEAPTK